MTYRRLSFIFAVFFVLHGATSLVKTEPDSLPIMDNFIEIDGKLVTRRGLITQIAQALEGVVAVTEDVLNIVLSPIKQLIKLDQEAILENPHKNDIASVRLGGVLCPQELAFRDQRFAVVKAAQERFLGMELEDDDVLEVALSGSGGGMRAKIYSLGAWIGADKIGLLDTIMCMSGLSGTTWFLAPWISSGLPLGQYREFAIQDACEGIDIQKFDDLGPMLDSFWVKFAYNQHLNIVDLYGALLGNNFLRGFGKKQHMIYLSDQRKQIVDGSFPLPIYTAGFGERDMPNYWFEFTPFEIGSRWLGAYVPSWAFGRKFKKGKSKSFAPEMSLGFLMGIFGSAFSASFEETYKHIIRDMQLPTFLHGVPGSQKIFEALKKFIASFVVNSDFGELRIAWGQVFNYVYKMRGCTFHKHEDLKLVDAGIDFSNPIFATYRKPPHGGAPDVVVVVDSSLQLGFDTLKSAEHYALRMGMPFPKIDRSGTPTEVLTVFGNASNPTVPLVLYMPFVTDKDLLEQSLHDPDLCEYADKFKNFDAYEVANFGFAQMINFEYTREHAELLADFAEFNVRASADRIKDIFKAKIAAKRARRNAGKIDQPVFPFA